MSEFRDEAPAVRDHLDRSRRQVLRALLPEGLAGLDTLELGCGAGDFMALLVAEGQDPARMTGIDQDAGRLARAALRFPGASLTTADLRRAEFGRDRSDLVVFSQVLSQIVDREERRDLLLRAAQALGPGGRIVIHDMLVLRGRSKKLGFRRFAPQDLARVLPDGFEVRAFRRCTLLPPLLRLVAPLAPGLAGRLERLPALRGHWMALLARSSES